MSKKIPPTRIYTVSVILDKIVAVRDDTGVLPAQKWPSIFVPFPVVAPITPNTVGLDDLLEKNLVILYRETRQLLELSARGILGKDNAHSVRENLKLIVDLKKKETDLLTTMTDEDLAKYLQTRKP